MGRRPGREARALAGVPGFAARHGRNDKTGIAIKLMLTSAHTAAAIERSFVSYRAHAEGYLTWAADPPSARARFDRAYRDHRAVLLNYTYLQLTRMGLTPLDRFRLCHLTTNAVEEVYGVRAEDLIRSYVESRPEPAAVSAEPDPDASGAAAS